VAYVIDRVDAAEDQITSSAMPKEAKEGLIQTIASFKTAFTMPNMNLPVRNFFPTFESSLSNFALLVSVTGLPDSDGDIPDADNLIAEMQNVLAELTASDIDPAIADVAKRHIAVLLTLLRNVTALGPDAALAAYYELVVRLQRAEATAPAATKHKIAELWPYIEKWAGRIALLYDATQAGASLLTFTSSLTPMLPHLPSITG
jgi:hypothetical protein